MDDNVNIIDLKLIDRKIQSEILIGIAEPLLANIEDRSDDLHEE